MTDDQKITHISPAQTKNDYLSHKRKIYVRAGIYTFICLLLTALIVAVFSLNSKIDSLTGRVARNEEAIAVFNAEPEPEVSKAVYFYDKDYGNMWVTTPEEAPKNTYDYSALEFDDGRYSYSPDGEKRSASGIDISYHQGDIDWDKVAADGIDFAIIRLGYRGYETNRLNLDERFEEYCNGAAEAGIDVGAYFYSHAKNADEAEAEADFVIEHLKELSITYPVVFDWEATVSENEQAGGVMPEVLSECADVFCKKIAAAGYTPMIYGSQKILMCKLDLDALKDYKFWYAEYKDGKNTPDYEYAFDIWQYASDGRVDGIDGDVDLNICFADYSKVKTENDSDSGNE